MNKQKYLSRASVILCLLLLMLAGGCKKKAPGRSIIIPNLIV